MKRRAFVLLILLFIGHILSATLTNESVIKLSTDGISDDIIISVIQKGDNDFDTSADGIIALKQAGISDSVIKAMITGAPAPAPAAPAQAAPRQIVSITLPEAIVPEIGGVYYTRYSLHYEKGHFYTTNYARGAVLPINTKVTLLAADKDELRIQVDGGMSIVIKNVQKFSCKTLDEIAAQLLAAQPSPIDEFPADIASAIRDGELRLGMTRQQAIL
ncbi:MAG TPA: hypothetical protein PKI32_10235, partial [Opitutales bacterium]|nr:hypothetical protein [Opitutales bacterium]